MKKTRRRVTGKHFYMCSTFIAKLAGVSPVTVRRFLKGLGRPAKASDIRRFIFEIEANKIAKSIRENGFTDIADRMSDLLQSTRSK